MTHKTGQTSGPQNVRTKLAGEQALRFGKRRGKSGCKEALARLDPSTIGISFPSPHIRLSVLRNERNFACGRNPGFWNPEFSSSNSESKFHWQRIQSPQRGFQNLRLSWISLHGVDFYLPNVGWPFRIVILAPFIFSGPVLMCLKC